MDDVIWLRPERAGRGPAPEHSRAEIAAAAVALADAGGLAAATMRQVADAVGTRPASLYRYVRGRDELLALMADRIAAEVVHPEPSGDHVHDLTAVAHALVEVYVRHPWAQDVVAGGVLVGPRAMDHLEHCLTILAPLTDVPGTQKMETIAMLTGIAILWARQTAAGSDPALPERQAGLVAVLMAAAADGRHPQLAATLGAAAAGGLDPTPDDSLFDRTVGAMIRGLLAPRG